MKRIAFLLGVLALVCLSLPCSADLQTRRRQIPPATNRQAPAQPAEIEPLLKTAARQLQNKNFVLAYQTANQALSLSQQHGPLFLS